MFFFLILILRSFDILAYHIWGLDLHLMRAEEWIRQNLDFTTKDQNRCLVYNTTLMFKIICANFKENRCRWVQGPDVWTLDDSRHAK